MNKDCERNNKKGSNNIISKLQMETSSHRKDDAIFNELEQTLKKIKISSATDITVKKQGNSEETDIRNVSTYDDTEAALRSQDVKFRDKVLEIIDNDVKSRKELRNKLLTFYIWFISLVTIATFWILIDPPAVFRNRNSYYPLSLKITMATTFLINLIAILVIMVKYAFTSSMENMTLKLFDEIGFHKKSRDE